MLSYKAMCQPSLTMATLSTKRNLTLHWSMVSNDCCVPIETACHRVEVWGKRVRPSGECEERRTSGLGHATHNPSYLGLMEKTCLYVYVQL
jgi:hypothetical protein